MRVAVILWCMLGISGIGVQVLNEVNAEKVWEKFKAIEEYCIEALQEHIRKNETKSKGQILCVNIMTADEVNAPVFPGIDRTESILNMKRKDIRNYLPQSPSKPIHGEILAMEIDKTIEKLIESFKNSKTYQEGSMPYVFVYSKLIPCYGLIKWPYSCAEELAVYGRVNETDFHLLVGYSEPYEHTNESMAKRYLHQRGIFAIADLSSQIGQAELAPNGFNEPSIKIFQLQFRKCVNENEKFCGRGCEHCKGVKKGVVFNRVNELVYNMITGKHDNGTDQHARYKKGPLTKLKMTHIKMSFDKQKWAKCCDAGRPEERKVMKECFSEIMDENYGDPATLLVLGKPSGKTWLSRRDKLGMMWHQIYKGFEPKIIPGGKAAKIRERVGSNDAKSQPGAQFTQSRNGEKDNSC